MTLPPFPVYPGATATPEELLAFTAQVALYDLALRTTAVEQEDAKRIHRDRMATATEANASALRAVADKTETSPTIAEQKRHAVIQLLSTQARGNRKPATFMADVREQVDAIFAVLSASGV